MKQDKSLLCGCVSFFSGFSSQLDSLLSQPIPKCVDVRDIYAIQDLLEKITDAAVKELSRQQSVGAAKGPLEEAIEELGIEDNVRTLRR